MHAQNGVNLHILRMLKYTCVLHATHILLIPEVEYLHSSSQCVSLVSRGQPMFSF